MAAVAGLSQTLDSVLRANGIPTDQFTAPELGERISAANGSDGPQAYMVYLTLPPTDKLSNAPVMVKYDRATGKVIRRNLKPSEMENCCGSPLEIDFTKHYLLVSFHDNPSAETVMVAGKDLSYKTTLYGFDFHEITPDLVVYVEDLIHFAPQHPERLAWADLRSGREGELYPPKGDRLRMAFAAINEQQEPATAECQQANDPCDPAIYDEDIKFVPGGGPRGIAVRVTRTGNHAWVTKNEGVEVPLEQTLYVYKVSKTEWLYCEQVAVPAKLVKSSNMGAMNPGVASANCKPDLPVASDRSGQLNPFSPNARKGK
jgi:hypothetical protein